MNKFYAWMGGRTTFFALAYFTVGAVLAFKVSPAMLAAYTGFGTPVLAFLTVKSHNDNRHEQEMAKIQPTSENK